jgi:hypothetical protein
MAANERAGLNFLEWFHESHGCPVADKVETVTSQQIAQRATDNPPPFLFVTGNSLRWNDRDLKAIRAYINAGGMLFGDAGSRRFHADFVKFCNELYPDKRMRFIAGDDEILRVPYQFPHGAPPMWHHGGDRALGLKHEGRWVVFYHPGDVADALETGGSGAPERNVQAARMVVANVVWYAIRKHAEHRRADEHADAKAAEK